MSKIKLHRDEALEPSGMSSLQTDLDRIIAVVSSWNLSLNPSKCIIMRVSHQCAGLDLLGGGL